MKIGSHYKNQLAQAFKMQNAPTLITRALHKSTMAVTELRCDQRDFGRTTSMPGEDAYLVAVQLRACHDHDLYFDGRLVRPENWSPGITTIFDLRRDPIADIRDPFHSLMFYLPRRVLDAIAEESGARRIGDLRDHPGVGLVDPVVGNLLSSLLPTMAKPQEANSIFLDHVALALSVHVAQIYGGMTSGKGSCRGGLAPWQVRRAKEMMEAMMKEDLTLAELASACNLSVRHFARAFRQSTGLPPHRWLLNFRVQHARELLANQNLSLTQVATLCGFADQSHFTRTYTATMGVSPGAWRRMHKSASVAVRVAD